MSFLTLFVRGAPLLTLTAALLLSSARAQSITVTVDPTSVVRKVDERVFGLNAVLWDPQTASPETTTLLRAAGLRALRLPGGSLSDEYHWATNTNLAYTWHWASSVADFIRLITALGPQVFATVNYGTGTPEEAAAWVAYTNAPATLLGSKADVLLGVDARGTDWKTAGYWSDLRAARPLPLDDGRNFLRLGRADPVGIRYWELGNECYGTWETDEQAVAHDPYTYAVRARSYSDLMKAVDPTIALGVVAVTGEDANANNTSHPAANPRTGKSHNGWTPVMLATLLAQGVTPDFLIYHRYEQAPGGESDAGLLQAARTWGSDAADLRQQLTDYLGAAGAAVELAVTENNSVYADPGKQTTSLVNGLYLADSVGSLMQTEFNALLWWDLRNGPPTANGVLIGNQGSSLYGWRKYGDYGILSTPATGGATGYNEAYPTYYALKLLGYFARGADRVVRTTSSSNLLAVYAVHRDDGTLRVLAINKDPANTRQAAFTLTGYSPASTATTYAYGITEDNAAQSAPATADITIASRDIAGSSFTTSFAPYSATVLVLTEATGTPVTPAPPAGGTTTPAPAGGGGGGGGAPSPGSLLLLATLALGHRKFSHRTKPTPPAA